MTLDKDIKEEIKEYLTTHPVKNKEVIKKYLEKRMTEKKRKLRIISSYKLTESEIDLILNKFLFLKKVSDTIENQVDPKIVAGIIIKFGSKVLDLTLESQLKSLQKSLYELS